MSRPLAPLSVKKQLRQPDNLDVPVWRFMSLARLLWLLQKRQLWLAPLDVLSDRFEGIAPSTQAHAVLTTVDLSAYGVDATTDRAEALQRIRRRIFVSSWHMSAHESDALWRVYCPTEGIAIRTTYRKLRDSVGGLPVGMVEYVDFGSYRQPYDPMLGAWLKRTHFSTDQEVRVGLYSGWLSDPCTKEPERRTIGMPIDWPLEQAIERIVVYPQADYSYIEAVTDLVGRLVPHLPEPVVMYSALASHPPY